MNSFYCTQKALEYILEHEKEDFLEQCEEHGLSYEDGLVKLDNHVYYCAMRGIAEIEETNESTSIMKGQLREIMDLIK